MSCDIDFEESTDPALYDDEAADLYGRLDKALARIAELEAEVERLRACIAELVDLHNAEQDRADEARAEVEESDRALTEVTDRLGAANAEVERAHAQNGKEWLGLRAKLAEATKALGDIKRIIAKAPKTPVNVLEPGVAAALAKLGKGGA